MTAGIRHRAEHATLKQEEELFELLAKEAKEWAVFELDLKGQVIRWNSGAQHLTGYEAKEIIGRHFSILFPPRDRKGGKPARELIHASTCRKWEAQERTVRKDGSEFWAHVITRALRDETGALRGFARVMHDRTQAEGAQASLALFMELWDNVPTGMVVLRPTEGPGGSVLRILAGNAALLKILRLDGLEVDDLLGKTWPEIADAFPSLLSEHFSKTLLSVSGSEGPRNPGEIRRRAKGALEEVFSVKALPLPQRCVGLLFDDLTVAKTAEKALQQSEARFRALLDAAGVGLALTDRTGRMLCFNRQMELLFGYGRKELEGLGLEGLLAESSHERLAAGRTALLTKPRLRVTGIELRLLGRRKDGSEFPLVINLTYRQQGGEVWICNLVQEAVPN